MATATSAAFTLQEETGRDYVTLTSYSGPITWATTPVSGDQIEYPDSISVGSSGSVTAPAGTYLIRHIVSATGAIQAVSYNPTAQNSASDTAILDTDLSDNFNYVTLSSYSGPMTFATTPIAGDQIVFPTTISIDDTGAFTGANNTYTIWHIIASSGVIESISYTHSGSNTAPVFGGISDVVSTVGDIELFSISASDPDISDVLTYSYDVLPSGINLTGSSVQGTYVYEETVNTTFTVNDGSGGTDTLNILFSIARAGYTITTIIVNYENLNPDSPLIGAITDSDFTVGDQIDYPITATDAVGETRTIGFASDGLMTVTGTRSIKVDGIYIRDSSASYARVGPFSVTLTGTGPTLTSPLEVVPNSATTSGGQMRFTSDEGSEVVGANGDYRLIAITSGFGTPTRAQVMAGLGPDGNAALFDSGLLQQAATVEEVVTVTGLPTAGAGYWIFLCLEDQYGGRTLEGPVTLTTVASGTPPVWSTVPNQTFNEGTNPNFDLSAYVTDFVSITLSWSPALSLNTGTTFNNTTGLLGGTVNTNDASGSPGSTTTHTVTATATNATGSSSTTFDVGFYRLNPPVVSGSIANQSWQEGQAINFGLGTAITGATTYELQIDNGGFADGTAELATYALTFNNSTGVISGTINNTMAANSPFSMRARGVNADGNSAWETFTVNVTTASGAGFFGPIPNQTFSEGSPSSFNFSAYFTNAESYSISGLPNGTGLSLDSSTGILSGTPNTFDSAASPMSLVVTAVNSNGNATGPATLSITSLNPPVLTAAFPDVINAVGDTFTITPGNNFTGEDSIQVLGLPTGSGLSFDGTTLTGTLSSADKLASPYPITIRAINTDGNKDDTFLMTVTGAQFTDGTIITPAIRTMTVGDKRSLSPKVYIQDPADRIDYAVDLSGWLGADTILSATVASGDGVVVEGIKSATAVQTFVTGGTIGESDKVTARVTTTQGRVLDTSFYVAFVDM